MNKIKKILKSLLRFKSAEEMAQEHQEAFRAKKNELEVSVKTHLQMMQSLPEFKQGLRSLDRISSVLIYKKLTSPLFYKVSALGCLQEMLSNENIDEKRVRLMFLKETSGFEAMTHNLVWVYDGYFVSVGMSSYLGYIAEIEKTTCPHGSNISCLTLSSRYDEGVFKNVVLYFNVLTMLPEKICLEIFDRDDCTFRSTIIKEYTERPNEQRLIKDCRYYQKYFL